MASSPQSAPLSLDRPVDDPGAASQGGARFANNNNRDPAMRVRGGAGAGKAIPPGPVGTMSWSDWA
jgi:hypothetical protein